MSRPAVFFDRDNTLIANDGYLGDANTVVLITGAAKAIARARALGFAVVTVSNQSGVARGMFTEEAVHAVNARMDEMLQDQHPNARIDRHEFCPFHPDAVVERYKQESDLRKPGDGMLRQAAERLNLDLSRSWLIGDAPRDIEAGKAAGCRTILFADPSLAKSPAAEQSPNVPADFVATSLQQVIDIIERNKMTESQDTKESPADTEGAESSSSPAAEPVAVATGEAAAGQSEAPALKSAAAPASPQKMTFAERVRAGTYHPARGETGGVAVHERPKRAVTGAGEAASSDTLAVSAQNPRPVADASADARPTVHATEPLSETEVLEPILQGILEELRLRRHHQPGNEFAVSKLLAGIVQVLVLPALFFAYLHRDTAGDLQSMLLLATFLQTLTISLLIMGRQQ